MRKEAVWAVANLVQGGSPDQVAAVSEQGLLVALCDLLTVTDATVVVLCLDSLAALLKQMQPAVLSALVI